MGQRKFLEAQNRLEVAAEAAASEASPEAELSNGASPLDLYRGLTASLLNQAEKAKQLLENAAKSPEPIIAEKAKRVLQAYKDFSFAVDVRIEYLQTLLAEAFDEIGEYEMAIAIALDSLKSKEDYRDTWIILGHAYFAERKYRDASSALSRAIELDASSPLAHFYLGLTLGALQDHEGAIRELTKAESLGLDGGIFSDYQKAKSFDALGKYEDAYELYVKVLDQKGKKASPDEYLRPVTLAIEILNAPEKAFALAGINFSLHSEDPMSLYLLGLSELSLSKTGNAEKHFTQALAMLKKYPDITLEQTIIKKLQSITTPL